MTSCRRRRRRRRRRRVACLFQEMVRPKLCLALTIEQTRDDALANNLLHGHGSKVIRRIALRTVEMMALARNAYLM
jgi:hypothetical protein